MLTADTINNAIIEAERFLDRANKAYAALDEYERYKAKWEKALKDNPGRPEGHSYPIWPSKLTAAVRRTSLDLSTALSDMRRRNV